MFIAKIKPKKFLETSQLCFVVCVARWRSGIDLDSGAHFGTIICIWFLFVGKLVLVTSLVTFVPCLYPSLKLVLLVGFHVYSNTKIVISSKTTQRQTNLVLFYNFGYVYLYYYCFWYMISFKPFKVYLSSLGLGRFK